MVKHIFKILGGNLRVLFGIIKIQIENKNYKHYNSNIYCKK